VKRATTVRTANFNRISDQDRVDRVHDLEQPYLGQRASKTAQVTYNITPLQFFLLIIFDYFVTAEIRHAAIVVRAKTL